MTILAIDPGTTESALLEWTGEAIGEAGIFPNLEVKRQLHNFIQRFRMSQKPVCVAVEMVASYGMPVGKEIYETVLFIGRLQEMCETQAAPCQLIYRLEIKQHLCHDSRAKDSNIRQSLIDRFGPPGTKKSPGVLHGVKSHLWAALAVAVFAHDTLPER